MPDAKKALGATEHAMVFNSRTARKFAEEYARKVGLLRKEGYPRNYAEGLAFIETRYPGIAGRFRKSGGEFNKLSHDTFYDSANNRVNIGPKDREAPGEAAAALGHELRHHHQERVPRYPLGQNVLGPYPYKQRDKLYFEMEKAYDTGRHDRLLQLQQKYRELPHESSAFQSQETSRRAWDRFVEVVDPWTGKVRK